MSDGFWRSLSSLIYRGSSFVAFACEIAVLVAIATIVRRHRPDAYQGLQLWAIGSLVVFVVMNIARVMMPLLMRSSSDGELLPDERPAHDPRDGSGSSSACASGRARASHAKRWIGRADG